MGGGGGVVTHASLPLVRRLSIYLVRLQYLIIGQGKGAPYIYVETPAAGRLQYFPDDISSVTTTLLCLVEITGN